MKWLGVLGDVRIGVVWAVCGGRPSGGRARQTGDATASGSDVKYTAIAGSGS